jgi:hypothetical protein
MTPRERLFAALDGRSTDRPPVWLLFPYHRVPYYADVRAEPSYAPVVEAATRQAVALDRRSLGARLFAPDVEDTTERTTEGGVTVTRRTVRYRDRELRAEQRAGPAGTEVKRLLTTDEDMEAFLSLPLETDPDRLCAQLDAALPDHLSKRAAFPPERGATMLDLGEPVNVLYHSADLESYAVGSLTHTDAICDFLDRRMAQLREVYRYCLERQLAEVYFLVGSELAAPPLVSLETFRQWIVPYASEIVAMIRQAGARSILHFHGQIRELLGEFRALGPDALHTIESPPVGNCTLTQAYAGLGDRITPIGNIQYDDFRALSPQQMTEAVRAVLTECRGRRLILSPTAGPYEPTLSNRLRQNYLAFLDAAWQWGEWPVG